MAIKHVGGIITLLSCITAFYWLAPPELSAQDQSDKAYVIGAGDVLEIQVWDNDDLNRKIEVSQEGDFTFPFIGKVKASGLTVFGLETQLKQRLADGYLVRPHVTVAVAEHKSRIVYVLGQVQKPGTYPLTRKTHLLEIISEAGGFTDRAGRTVTIVRPSSSRRSDGPTPIHDAKENEIITVDLDQLTASAATGRYLVSNGDSIYVSEAPRVYVTGKVQQPGEFRWEKGLTVSQAIILAGGPTIYGSNKRATTIRSENGKQQEFKSALNDPVMPQDIIKVPGKGFFEGF